MEKVIKRENKEYYAQETLSWGHIIQTCDRPAIERKCLDCSKMKRQVQ